MAPRRRIIVAALCLVLVTLSLYFGREHLAQLQQASLFRGSSAEKNTNSTTSSPSLDTNVPHVLGLEKITHYVESIMNHSVTDPPRLECPAPKKSRYQYLQSPKKKPADAHTIDYFFALDLKEVLELLPQLIGSILEAIRFLGPENCALSIVGGNSPDGTGEILEALRPRLEALRTTYYFQYTGINPLDGDRIGKLAQLRNMALQPMRDSHERYTSDTTVVFLNDVAICTEDILELVHQRRFLGADMTCAFDWTYAGENPTFYDVWIARGMTGDSFFDIPPDGNWNSAWNLFWNDPEAQGRFYAHRPFQVFSCWNGAVAFTAKPVIEGTIAFRNPREGECFQGEPKTFCKEMWFYGYGKIATIPSINLEYSLQRGKEIKAAKGYTSQWLNEDGAVDEEDRIQWQLEPPELVRCIGLSYKDQLFRPWNETLT